MGGGKCCIKLETLHAQRIGLPNVYSRYTFETEQPSTKYYQCSKKLMGYEYLNEVKATLQLTGYRANFNEHLV